MNTEQKTFETLEFIVPSYSLCALINGDFSGLTEEEETQINKFIEETAQTYGSAFFSPDVNSEEYFSWHNDIDSLGGIVCRVFLTIETTKN